MLGVDVEAGRNEGMFKNSQVFGVRFESLDRSKCEGSSGSLRSYALMGYLCGGQCRVTVRGCALRLFALMGYLRRGQCWVTVRSGSLRS